MCEVEVMFFIMFLFVCVSVFEPVNIEKKLIFGMVLHIDQWKNGNFATWTSQRSR